MQGLYGKSYEGIEMTILTKAGKDYKCSACKIVIAKGDKHLAKPRYQYGTDRFCVNCIMRELKDMVCFPA